MIDAVTAAGFLGKEVRIADTNVLVPRVQMIALRVHPSSPTDYLVETSTGLVFTGSDLRALESPRPEEES